MLIGMLIRNNEINVYRSIIVPQLSKCLKFEAIRGGGGGGLIIRLIKGFAIKQRDNKTCGCIVVQRMAHHNHAVHLNHPHLSFVNLW